MTHHDDDARVADLVARLGDADATDLFRRLVQRGMQDLIDAELLQRSVPSPMNEPTPVRTNAMVAALAPCRPRLVVSSCGSQAARRVVLPVIVGATQAGRQGVVGGDHDRLHHRHLDSKVDDLVRALGCESGVSISTVSRACAGIDARDPGLPARPLGHIAMSYVYLDATYIKARNAHRIVSRAVVVATAVTIHGNRGVLGVGVGDSNDEVFWTTFFAHPRLSPTR